MGLAAVPTLTTKSPYRNGTAARRATVQRLSDLRSAVKVLRGEIAATGAMLAASPAPRKLEILRLSRDGLTKAAIAKCLGVPLAIVRRISKSGRPRSAPMTVAFMCRLFAGGMPKQAIARQLKVSRSSVYRIPNPRTRGQARADCAVRPRTEHDKRIRDVRRQKHPGWRLCVWRTCLWCKGKFTGRQWLSHEYQCSSRPSRPPPDQIVDFGRVKKRAWGKLPYKWHKCPFCKNKFTGRQWLAHKCKERNRTKYGEMWLTPQTAAVVSTPSHELSRPQTQPLAPGLPGRFRIA
jgi:DNA-binding CsgD family transcriptional regulator